MNISQALFLGIVQGVTEFLPISSSGHLIVMPWLLKWQRHSLSFDVMLHAGTLFALIIYFGRYWIKLMVEGISSIKKHPSKWLPEGTLFWLIILATIPGAIAGKFLEEKAETVFRSPLLIALAMGSFAVIFYIIDRWSRKNKTLYEIKIIEALIIGVFQALAIIPGISRSAITIAAGLALRLNREAAIRFSFLLSAPIILGAVILKIKAIAGLIYSPEYTYLLSGFLSAAITGLLSIYFLLRFIKKHNFNLFILYRIVFCLVILSFFFLRSY